MKPNPFSTARAMRGLYPVSAGLLLAFLGGSSLSGGVFQFHHEDILGTSLDLQVSASGESMAALAEKAALAEIERLRRILSGYDPESELSKVNSADAPVVVSQEMIEVLRSYDTWQKRSKGAYSGQLGPLVDLWSKGEKAGAAPSTADLEPVMKAVSSPGWLLDARERKVTRLAPVGAINVNSLGKGYIVTKAAMAAKRAVPELTGLLLNIGGDIYASGDRGDGSAWEIGVADPNHSEDNAAPLTKVHLTDRAISTSAAYERGFTIAGKKFSHILDPRTGKPADGVASATVISFNNANANAMATTLCVLSPEEGLELIKSVPGSECLIVTKDGKQIRSSHFAAYEGTSAAGSAKPPAGGSEWPQSYQVSIEIDLKVHQPGSGKNRQVKRPYVAVWVEDASGKRVRTVTVWGNERKYLKDLRTWWSEAKSNADWAVTVTRATRKAGKHRLQWDGTDDQGQPLPLGTYTIKVEANREHGTYSLVSGGIICGKSPFKATLKTGSEFAETQLNYGPADR